MQYNDVNTLFVMVTNGSIEVLKHGIRSKQVKEALWVNE